MRCGIMEGINNAANFAMQVELGVLTLTGYFQPGDVTVLDEP